MMGNKARLGICAATAALAAVAVAGCSGSGSSSSGSGAAGSGGAKAGSGSSAAISLVADAMNKAAAAGAVKVTGTMTAPGMSTPMTFNAQEQYSPSLAMSMSLQVQGQTLSEILVGDVIYMDYPALSAELGGGKQWMEIDLSKATSFGSVSSLLDSARNENPTTQIAALVASGDVSKVGTATVQGQQTTHYAGTLDASQVVSASGAVSGLTATQLSSLKSELQSVGVTSVKIDLWVASNGLPVEEKYAEQTSAGAVAGNLYMSDWGAPVSVGAPPASEVTNVTNQLNSTKAGASASASAGS
jgi:LppX_LprAFG lipoprotein